MKTLLIAINSQYAHTNLAVAYLKAACNKDCGLVQVLELTINENLKLIYDQIIREKPDVAAFSCYIWNIEIISKLVSDIRKAAPNMIIVAGGPEISFDKEGLLSHVGRVDYFIRGEGEEKLPLLLRQLNQGTKPDEKTIEWLSEATMAENLDQIPFPYTHFSAGSLKDRIAYVESSRGCPFRCSYCISSMTGGVRYFSLDWVDRALAVLVASGTKIIKFVDRTFNANEERALKILSAITQYSQTGIVFHLEIDPGLLTGPIMNRLAEMPDGLVQIEAGIQSVHEKTLSAVERPWRIEQAFSNLKRILGMKNIHVHVDLIAGLPFETFPDFRVSFSRVYDLFAHHFQLGFLKMLRGSQIRKNAEFHQYAFSSYPPYEILSNQSIKAEELLELKDVANCVDLFYNTGRFATTMKWMDQWMKKQEKASDAFGFYKKLAADMRQQGYLKRPLKAKETYFVLYRHVTENYTTSDNSIMDCLRFDYLRAMKNPAIPEFLVGRDGFAGRKKRVHSLSENHGLLEKVIPRLKKNSLKQIFHQIYVISFHHLPEVSGFPREAVIAFDFGEVSPVTGLAAAYALDV